MIRTRNKVLSLSQIDTEWAFTFLLGPLSLNGGDCKIRSPFSEDKTPSFSIYKYGDRYLFRCFSTGIRGNYLDLYIELQKQKGIILDKKQAVEIIKSEFESFLNTGQYIAPDAKIVKNGKGRVVEWELRRWDDIDIQYWGKYEIETLDLEYYNVAPISSYVMEKLVNGELKRYVFNHDKMYGYFLKDGSLYTIYCPERKPKFTRVGFGRLLGEDQIVKPAQNLIYIKALKDGIVFKKMGFKNYDFKVVDAESTLVSKEQVEKDKKIYKKIWVWMDLDSAGKKASAKYKELYDLDSIEFNLGPKDLSDAIPEVGFNLAKLHLLQLL